MIDPLSIAALTVGTVAVVCVVRAVTSSGGTPFTESVSRSTESKSSIPRDWDKSTVPPMAPRPRSQTRVERSASHTESARRDEDDLLDPLNAMSPLNPLNPLNPLSPLWVGNSAADAVTVSEPASGGDVFGRVHEVPSESIQVPTSQVESYTPAYETPTPAPSYEAPSASPSYDSSPSYSSSDSGSSYGGDSGGGGGDFGGGGGGGGE